MRYRKEIKAQDLLEHRQTNGFKHDQAWAMPRTRLSRQRKPKRSSLGNASVDVQCKRGRAAHALDILADIGSPQLIFDDQASVVLFSEAEIEIELEAFDVCTDQCRHDASSRKPTCFRVLLPKGIGPTRGKLETTSSVMRSSRRARPA
jgi:DsbC/DsbD-like thiol-disulfide interchange protein